MQAVFVAQGWTCAQASCCSGLLTLQVILKRLGDAAALDPELQAAIHVEAGKEGDRRA